MSETPDYDLEEMLYALDPVLETYAEGSTEREAAMLAQSALFYLRESGQEAEFLKHYKWGRETPFTTKVSQEFATRAEADQWLASGKAHHKERVKIAGKGFMVVQLPGRQILITRPFPEELDSADQAAAHAATADHEH